MARSVEKQALLLLLGLSALLATAIADEIKCESIPIEYCAFSVSTAGNRCVLEKYVEQNGDVKHQCMSSVVMAENFAEWIETDECVSACGLDRNAVGMSSDALMESGNVVKKLCSAQCMDMCPNLVDLFMNLAAGEGISLQDVCRAQNNLSFRRMMMDDLHYNFNWNLLDSSFAPSPAPVTFPMAPAA